MNPYIKGNNAYKKASVTTKDQCTLILMLYDGAIRFLKVALTKVEEEDIEGAHQQLVKAKNIVEELLASLKAEQAGELGAGLQSLYTYIYNRLIDANIQKEKEPIIEVINLLSEIREGWREIVKMRKAPNPMDQLNLNQNQRSLNING